MKKYLVLLLMFCMVVPGFAAEKNILERFSALSKDQQDHYLNAAKTEGEFGTQADVMDKTLLEEDGQKKNQKKSSEWEDFSQIERLFIQKLQNFQKQNNELQKMVIDENSRSDLFDADKTSEKTKDAESKVGQQDKAVDPKAVNTRNKDKDNDKDNDNDNDKEAAIQLSPAELEQIRQFGYDIFKLNVDTTFTKENIPAGDHYILGPGDQLIIYVWGKLEQRFEETIDNQGKISLPQIGQLYLAQTSLKTATEIIKKEMSKFYVNFEVRVSLGQLRTIRVYMLGDIQRPGAYNIPSLSTLFYALFQAGGPTQSGSMRNIRLIRNKKTIHTTDLYYYLLKGKQHQDRNLQDGDTIFISAIGNVVMLNGPVKKPGIYEIKKTETLLDMIHWAGNSAEISGGNVQIFRTKSSGVSTIYNLAADADLKVNLVDYDIVKVASAFSTTSRFVNIQGAVNRPNQYELNDGMVLSDLIELAGGFHKLAYADRIDIYRIGESKQKELLSINPSQVGFSEVFLEEWDQVKVYRIDEIAPKKTVYIDGAVQEPGFYPLLDNMRVSDLAFLAQVKSYAYLEHTELFRQTKDADSIIITMNLDDILQDSKTQADLFLQENDHIFIKQRSDTIKKRKVSLSGEFVYPGTYIIRTGEKLSSLIRRAGGFTNKAFLRGAVFKRESVKALQQESQQRILKEEKKRIIYEQAKLTNLSYETYSKLSESREQALDLLEDKSKENLGRIIIALTPLDIFENTQADLVIEDGDTLFVPPIPSSVQVIGGVQHASAIYFKTNTDRNYYIEQSGGLSEYANRDRIYVFKANGSIAKNATSVARGDTIYVPEYISVPIDWLDILAKVSQSVYNIAFSVLSLNALTK